MLLRWGRVQFRNGLHGGRIGLDGKLGIRRNFLRGRDRTSDRCVDQSPGDRAHLLSIRDDFTQAFEVARNGSSLDFQLGHTVLGRRKHLRRAVFSRRERGLRTLFRLKHDLGGLPLGDRPRIPRILRCFPGDLFVLGAGGIELDPQFAQFCGGRRDFALRCLRRLTLPRGEILFKRLTLLSGEKREAAGVGVDLLGQLSCRILGSAPQRRELCFLGATVFRELGDGVGAEQVGLLGDRCAQRFHLASDCSFLCFALCPQVLGVLGERRGDLAIVFLPLPCEVRGELRALALDLQFERLTLKSKRLSGLFALDSHPLGFRGLLVGDLLLVRCELCGETFLLHRRCVGDPGLVICEAARLLGRCALPLIAEFLLMHPALGVDLGAVRVPLGDESILMARQLAANPALVRAAFSRDSVGVGREFVCESRVVCCPLVRDAHVVR